MHLVEQAVGLQVLEEADPARIGPTVCELEGPMPTVNMSNTLTAM
ncbi:hypothetical protein [Propionibacterium freudenreichii]